MSRHVPIVDETLRDGHQCLWSTRMTNEMMLPIASRMDHVGFDSIDLIGGAVWDVAVRFLKEDPWERMRHVRKLVTATPLNAIVRGQSLWTFEVFPNDVVELAIERLKANGIAQPAVYDQFNDLGNVEVCVAKANEVGLGMGTLVFSWASSGSTTPTRRPSSCASAPTRSISRTRAACCRSSAYGRSFRRCAGRSGRRRSTSIRIA
jgi:oxaloacetate decarboxylase alpha subunit